MLSQTNMGKIVRAGTIGEEKTGVNQRIGKKKDKTVQEKRNGKSNVDTNMIAR